MRTKGPWKVSWADYKLAITDQDARVIAFPNLQNEDGDEDEANALFIAEAGTVAEETGLSPRQLADQRADLLAALKAIMEPDNGRKVVLDSRRNCELDRARAAIQRAEGK